MGKLNPIVPWVEEMARFPREEKEARIYKREHQRGGTHEKKN